MMKYPKLALSLFFLLLISCLVPLSAQEAVPNPDPLSTDISNTIPRELQLENYSFAEEFMNMLSTLGVFLLALLALAWMLRRVRQTRTEQINQNSLIKVIERRILAPKGILYLVEVEGQRMIISESPSGIHYLTSLPDSEGEAVTPDRKSEFQQMMQAQENQN